MYTRLRNRKQALDTLLLWWWMNTLVLACWQHTPLAAAQPVAQYYRGRYYEPICTDQQTGRELYVGEFFMRPGQCIRVQCLGTLHLWEDSCQVPSLNGNCRRLPAANEYLDYPKCCPMYECKSYEAAEHGEREETRIYDHYGMLHKTDIRQIFVVVDPREKGQVPGSGVMTQFQI